MLLMMSMTMMTMTVVLANEDTSMLNKDDLQQNHNNKIHNVLNFLKDSFLYFDADDDDDDIVVERSMLEVFLLLWMILNVSMLKILSYQVMLEIEMTIKLNEVQLQKLQHSMLHDEEVDRDCYKPLMMNCSYRIYLLKMKMMKMKKIKNYYSVMLMFH